MFDELLRPYLDAFQGVVRGQEEKQVARDETQAKILAELANANYTLDLIRKLLEARK